MGKNILAYQMNVEFGKPEENYNKVVKLLENTDITSDTLVLVPELFLTGYHKESIDNIASNLTDHEYVGKLIDMCADYQVQVFGSLPEEDNNQIFNTAVLVTTDGVISSYRKSHLFGPMGEKQLFTRGNDVVTVELSGIMFGLSICYDLRFPELYQIQAKHGAQVFLNVAEWPITRVDHWMSLAKARAIENQAFMISLNRVGKDPGYHYGGHSGVYSPFGNTISLLEHDNEGVLSCDIDILEVKNFRNRFDVREDKWL